MRNIIKLLIILSSIYAVNAYPLSPAQEQQMGKVFMQNIKRQVPLVKDPLINSYIKTIGNKLAVQTNRPTRFYFFMIKNNDVNAFSVPGGYIGVNAGLVLLSRSESELAAVLAHEVAHVTQRHFARAVAHQKKLTIPTIAATLAAIVLGTTVNSNAAAGAMGAATGGSAQSMLNFMRQSEQEADRMGMQILHAAGFDPDAMPIFLQRLQQINLNSTHHLASYFSTHPLTINRVADTQNRAYHYADKEFPSSLDYYLIRARLRVLLSKTGKEALQYFHTQLKRRNYQNKNAAMYGYALAALKAKKPNLANKAINQLLKHSPHKIEYQMALANIKMAQHKPQQALTTLQKSLEFYPDSYPLVSQYAAILIAANRPKQAAKLLDKQIFEHPNDEYLYALLIKAKSKTGDLAGAYMARAKVYALNNRPKMAVVQLEQALKQPNLDQHTKEIIRAQIKKIAQS